MIEIVETLAVLILLKAVFDYWREKFGRKKG
jgi:hypothetical protein